MTGELVGYESWLERDRLALLDYDPRVVGVASQPFRLRWRDEAGRVQVAHLGVPTSFPNLVGSLVGQSWGPGTSEPAPMTHTAPTRCGCARNTGTGLPSRTSSTSPASRASDPPRP